MVKKRSIKKEMLEHSVAKVDLYSTYLENYLSVLSNTPFIKTINIFDLFCGEGLYEKNQEGSPLAGIKKADKLLNTAPSHPPNINFHFNDNGKSEFEPNISKIERLENIVNTLDYHNNIKVHFENSNFEDALPKAIDIAKTTPESKSLFFIDPYGYKDVKPNFVKSVLSCRDAELILFLPTTPMYRFTGESCKDNKPSTKPLYYFLLELFGRNPEGFESIFDFIDQVKKQFKNYLLPDNLYVDTFTLQRDKSNTYCLFFFTPNALGFEKMLAAKWKMDNNFGRGFKLGRQMSLLFSDKISIYPKILKAYLLKKETVSNKDLYLFGLNNGFLPKHTSKTLREIIKNGTQIERYSMDGKPVNGYYISYKNAVGIPERSITIGIKKHGLHKN